ncbi:dihydrofolate reductase [Halobaculum sp. MBLA0147]|uniref:dihydrofolate reductase n=1 Tax=Halobaculum sp. MBLA0147 TaxID=3079934 RepID=UPI0035243CE3
MSDAPEPNRDEGTESLPRPDAEVVAIVAVAANGVIGRDGEMPWHLPEDMAHFERTTTGHPVVVGRRTYESIAAGLGGPLPDRTNVVLSRGDPDVAASVRVVDSLPAAFAVAERAIETEPDRTGPIFVAGGATVYEQSLPIVDRLVRTELEDSYAGDTEFPAWNRDAWRETSRASYDAFDVVEYVRDDEG